MKQLNPPATLGERLRWLREKHNLTLEQFGHLINFGRSYLSRLENGQRIKVSEHFLFSVCDTFSLRWDWLKTGEGEPFLQEERNKAARVSALQPPPQLKSLENEGVLVAANYAAGTILSLNHQTKDIANALLVLIEKKVYSVALRLEIARILLTEIDARLNLSLHEKLPDGGAASALGEDALNAVAVSVRKETRECDAKKDFTKTETLFNIAGVKELWPTLKKRLQSATAETGKKSELAKFLKLDLPRVSQWLSDKKSAREPGAEYTLQMLHWVEQKERQK